MKTLFSFLIGFIFVAILPSCSGNSESTSDNDTISTEAEEVSIVDKLKDVSALEEAKNLLNGTTWHYTENLDDSDIGCWIKVEFNNGKYTSYYALPSDGKWTRDKSGTYQLEEGRYTNTGNKYISVNWEGNIKNPQLGLTIPCEMAFTLSGHELNVHSPQIDAVLYDGRGMMKQIIMKGDMSFGDYNWD